MLQWLKRSSPSRGPRNRRFLAVVHGNGGDARGVSRRREPRSPSSRFTRTPGGTSGRRERQAGCFRARGGSTRYVRGLRPLTAIPLDAIFASAPYAAPLPDMSAPGYSRWIRPRSTAWPPRCAPRFSYCGVPRQREGSYWAPPQRIVQLRLHNVSGIVCDHNPPSPQRYRWMRVKR